MELQVSIELNIPIKFESIGRFIIIMPYSIKAIKRKAEIGMTALIVSLCCIKKRRIEEDEQQERRWWERPHLGVKNRLIFGQQNLLEAMRVSDAESFTTILRLRPESFDKLLFIVGPLLTKHSHREPINPSTRLAVTLR